MKNINLNNNRIDLEEMMGD